MNKIDQYPFKTPTIHLDLDLLIRQMEVKRDPPRRSFDSE